MRHFDDVKKKVLLPKVFKKMGYEATYVNVDGDVQKMQVLFVDTNDLENVGDFKVTIHSAFIEFEYNDYLFKNYMISTSGAHVLSLPLTAYSNSGIYKFVKILKLQDGQICLAQLQPL